jgi:hypothetical protein
VADAYNPSYSGGRDWEDHSSKPAQANSSRKPISKKSSHKKMAGGVAQVISLEFKFKLHYHKKKKNLHEIPREYKKEVLL